ncbi:vasorin a [Osmerus mordax]|uniref:vasorin a n=1 Tax=Osmerus mordax TaxID=8014 RepID=UPI00350EF195
MPRSLLLLLLFLLSSPASSEGCPADCTCQPVDFIFCIQRHSSEVPRGLPPTTRNLYVFQNGIATLAQDDFTGLGQLELLDLSQNELTEVPDGVFQPLSSLRNLDLSSNIISHVSKDSFSGLVQLERLYLHGNSIQSIQAEAFEDLKGLLELKLQKNHLSVLPSLHLPKLLLLDLSFNTLPTLGPQDLQTPHLESLKVSSLELTSLDEELMASLGNLHDLDVSHNKLEELPLSLWAAKGLIKLSLAVNPLRELGEKDFRKLVGLQVLDLSGLNIQEFPQTILQHLPRLSQITAAENPFNCLCPLAWFPTWLRENGVTLGRPEETRCHFPPANAGKKLADLDQRDFGCPPSTTLLAVPSSDDAGSTLPPLPLPTTSPETTHTNASPPPPPPPSEDPSATETDAPEGLPPQPAPSSSGEEHICPPNICLNGGTCHFDPRAQMGCVCPPGTSGLYCENLEEEEALEPLARQDSASVSAAAAAGPVTTPDPDDISSRQVTSTSILLDLHRFIETRPHIRGIRLSYRNLSGPDRRPMYLSVPANYPEYTLRGLRPNCTYSVCASPMGERVGGGGGGPNESGGSCMEARTAGQLISSPEPIVKDPAQITSALVFTLAALALVLGVAVVAGAVLLLRRRRAHAKADPEPDPAELSPLELEGVRTCVENGNGGTGGSGTGTPPLKLAETERPQAPVLPPSPQNGALECEAPLVQGQGRCSSDNNIVSMKPSYF